jgi:hypothetical protein
VASYFNQLLQPPLFRLLEEASTIIHKQLQPLL